MRKLSDDIDYFVSELSGNEDQARINFRARQVRARYKSVLQTVYNDTAPLFLAHTNNVYIMSKNGLKTLIVYVDESIFAAELNAQRELIKLKLLQEFKEEIEKFEIHVSRGSYKDNHPFSMDEPDSYTRQITLLPLDYDEQNLVKDTSNIVEDTRIKESFQKAMTAAMALNKTEKGKTR